MARARDLSAGGFRIELEFERARVSCPDCVRGAGGVPDWLARNPRYTARYALLVGALARSERLHHATVKDLDKLYMAE